MILIIATNPSMVALIPFISIKEGFSLPKTIGSLNPSDLSPGLRKFLIISLVFAISNFSYMFFILRAQEFFTGLSSIGDPLLLYAFFNVVYAIFSLPIGIWSDKVGRKKVLTLGYFLFSLTAAGFAIVPSVAGLVLLFALYGLAFSIIDASERAFVSDLSRATIRSSSLGIY